MEDPYFYIASEILSCIKMLGRVKRLTQCAAIIMKEVLRYFVREVYNKQLLPVHATTALENASYELDHIAL